jgi:sulfonate transport system substrate-binding protein
MFFEDVMRNSDPIHVCRGRRRVLRWAALSAFSPLLTAGADEPKAFHVGFQKGGGLLGLLKAQGTLEKSLGVKGWSVSWFEFPAGPQLLEALNAGSVHFGYTGAPPPVFAQAADKNIVYVGAEPSAPSAEAIIVKPNSPLKKAGDLKRKRVAVQKGSSANFLLVAALDHAGLTFADIEAIYLQPADARAAFESDRVDAWAIWDPYLAAAQDALKARTVADYTDLTQTNAFYESSREFAARSPEVLNVTLGELAKAGAWANSNPHEVAELLAPQLGLPVNVVETWQKRTHYGVQPIDSSIVATQQKVADAFFSQKLIPKQVNVADAVWTWRRV